jgi:hypothetical protein
MVLQLENGMLLVSHQENPLPSSSAGQVQNLGPPSDSTHDMAATTGGLTMALGALTDRLAGAAHKVRVHGQGAPSRFGL